MMKNKIFLILFIILMILSTGCERFLDERPQKSLVIPSSLEDLQAIMDDYTNFVKDPSYGEISADDYFLTTADWKSIPEEGHRRTYVWEKDYLFGTGTATDWLNSYRLVYAANTVLEKIEDIPREGKNSQQWDNVKGQALFLRARSFLSIASIWALAYDIKSAKKTLGIPLRLTSDFNLPSTRSSLEETYAVIVNDLKEAQALLTAKIMHPSRASKPAAFALLARTYLFMRDYDNCWDAANACLKLKHDLMDYNKLNVDKAFPVPEFNEEVIYVSHIGLPQPIRATRAKIDSILHMSYQDGDRRKKVFFNDYGGGMFSFKGSYMGSTQFFSGLATNEVYLMRAECAVRRGDLSAALDDLNTLLQHRWDESAHFEPLKINDGATLLDTLLVERRKELLMRGIRWPDIKRLNQEGRDIVLRRNIDDQMIELPPNDLRYALPIPEQIIKLTDLQQNPR